MSFQAMAWAVEQPAVTTLQKLILLMLANYADDLDESWPSQTTLARQCHCTRQGVSRALRDLEADGLITSLRRRSAGRETTKLYRLETSVTSVDTASVTSVDGQCNLSGHKPIIEPITSKKEAKTPPKKMASDFEEWWALYPHKIGKLNAKQKYLIARRTASVGELWGGLYRYIRDKPADRPWCNPATWLHQGRWKDEPAPPIPQRREKMGWGETAKAMIDEERNSRMGSETNERPALEAPKRI